MSEAVTVGHLALYALISVGIICAYVGYRCDNLLNCFRELTARNADMAEQTLALSVILKEMQERLRK